MFEVVSQEGPVCPASFWPHLICLPHTTCSHFLLHSHFLPHTQQSRVPFQLRGTPANSPPTAISTLLWHLLPASFPPVPVPSSHSVVSPRSAPSSEVTSQCPYPTCLLGGGGGEVYCPGYSLTPLPWAFRTSAFSVQNEDDIPPASSI